MKVEIVIYIELEEKSPHFFQSKTFHIQAIIGVNRDKSMGPVKAPKILTLSSSKSWNKTKINAVARKKRPNQPQKNYKHLEVLKGFDIKTNLTIVPASVMSTAQKSFFGPDYNTKNMLWLESLEGAVATN